MFKRRCAPQAITGLGSAQHQQQLQQHPVEADGNEVMYAAAAVREKDYLKALIKFISRGLTLKKERENLRKDEQSRRAALEEEEEKLCTLRTSTVLSWALFVDFLVSRSVAQFQVYIHRLKIPFGSCITL